MKKGILERVPAGEHNTWCSRMVIQEKKNVKARRTVDLSYLSKHGLDESHHRPSALIIAQRVPRNKYKWTPLTGTKESGWRMRTDTRQLLPQNGAGSATGEFPRDTYQ